MKGRSATQSESLNAESTSWEPTFGKPMFVA